MADIISANIHESHVYIRGIIICTDAPLINQVFIVCMLYIMDQQTDQLELTYYVHHIINNHTCAYNFIACILTMWILYIFTCIIL